MLGGGLFIRLQPNSTFLINSDYSTEYTVILLVEVVIILLNVNIIALMQYLAYIKPPCHQNMIIIISIWVLAYVPMGLFRISFIYRVIFAKRAIGLMRVQSVVKTLYVNMMILSLPTALMERTFAVYYIWDYERTRRFRAIIASLLLTAILFISFLWDILESNTNVLAFCIQAFTISKISEIWFIFLWRYNRKSMRLIKLFPSQYSLSIRFQIEENMRVFKLGIAGFVVIAMLIALGISAALLIVYHQNSTVVLLTQICADFGISAGMLPIYISFIMAVPEWRRFVFRLMRKNVVNNFKDDRVLFSKPGEEYFQQLAKS